MTELNRNSQLFFDYILPTVMAVGAGVGTYLLTGGEEEYPLEEEVGGCIVCLVRCSH